MSDTVHLEIVTPHRRVLAIDIDFVEIPGALGVLGVLPGHTPLLTSLGIGELMYRQGRSEHSIAVSSGFAEILPDRVTVMAEIAELPGEIDVEAAEREREEAAHSLRDVAPEDLVAARARLRLAETRLHVAERMERHYHRSN